VRVGAVPVAPVNPISNAGSPPSRLVVIGGGSLPPRPISRQNREPSVTGSSRTGSAASNAITPTVVRPSAVGRS